MKQFCDFFGDVIEYPNPAIEQLVPGVLFTYISDAFLNGWINYVGKVKSAWLTTRYEPYADNVERLNDWHKTPSFHSDFGQLRDDVHLITQDEGGKWWYFHYDRDVSDCKIGILDTLGYSEQEILAAFEEYVGEEVRVGRLPDNEDAKPLKIDVGTIQGWVSG